MINVFRKSKDMEILELKLRVKELEEELKNTKIVSKYDRAINRVVNFRTSEELLEYLFIKSQYNLQTLDLIGWYKDSTPKELKQGMIELRNRLHKIEAGLEADIEAAKIFSRGAENE